MSHAVKDAGPQYDDDVKLEKWGDHLPTGGILPASRSRGRKLLGSTCCSSRPSFLQSFVFRYRVEGATASLHRAKRSTALATKTAHLFSARMEKSRDSSASCPV